MFCSNVFFGFFFSEFKNIVLFLFIILNIVGHFVLSPREREKRDRSEGQGKKRNRNESEETEEINKRPMGHDLLT